jgi:hypothetical protein
LNVVHIKGFASGLTWNPTIIETIHKLTEDCTIFAFDGDDFDSGSYTNPMIVAFIKWNMSSNAPKKTLIAFKLCDEKFLWHDMLLEYDESDHSIALVPSSEAVVAFTVTIFLHTIELDPIPEKRYIELGKRGLDITGARKIVAIGGGQCIFEEHQLSRDSGVEWHCLPLSRSRNGQDEHCSLLGGDDCGGHFRGSRCDRCNISFH